MISSNTVERQPESLIIGKRKPSLEFQFQNKFRLGGEIIPRARSNNVIVRSKMIGGGSVGIGVGSNNRYKPRQTHYSSPVYDPCTDYLNNPMFHSLHSRLVLEGRHIRTSFIHQPLFSPLSFPPYSLSLSPAGCGGVVEGVEYLTNLNSPQLTH